jgi:membrane protein required for colicin V production
VDAAAAAILAVALLRGLWIGLVREAFSLAGLAAACLAVRFGSSDAAEALGALSPWPMAPLAAKILAGAILAVAAVLAVGLLGRLVRGGLHRAGLGALDRLGGGMLGAAEGALLLAVLVLGATALLGPTHPWLADSRAVALVQEARERAASPPGHVAAPPPDQARRAP